MKKYTDKTVVLDLDCTLIISSKNKIKGYDFILHFADDDDYYVKKRDHCDDFLHFCFTYFTEVIVWSAADEEYVNQIVDNIFIERQPDAVYNRSHTRFLDLTDHLKPLSNILSDLNHVYIIDDRMENFRENIDNGILISPYIGEKDVDLLKIQKWLLADETIQNNVKIDKNWSQCDIEDEMHYLVTSDRIFHLENQLT